MVYGISEYLDTISVPIEKLTIDHKPLVLVFVDFEKASDIADQHGMPRVKVDCRIEHLYINKNRVFTGTGNRGGTRYTKLKIHT